MLKSVYLLTLLMLLASCGKDLEENMSNNLLSGSFSMKNCFVMKPDFTFNYQNLSGYSKSLVEGNVYLTSLSSESIYTFEAETGLLVNKMNIEKEGPLAVGPTSSFDGVFYISQDSILYSSNIQNKIFLLTSRSVETIVDFSGVNNVRLASAFRNPPVEGKNHILFPVYPNRKEDIGKGFAFVAINKSLESFDQVISFTPAYEGKFFGTTPYFYWPSVAFNSKTDSYVASFPVSHSVFEYDSDFKLLNTDYIEGGTFALSESMFLLNEARLVSEKTVELPYDCLTFEAE